jgi:hypothetical protein
MICWFLPLNCSEQRNTAPGATDRFKFNFRMGQRLKKFGFPPAHVEWGRVCRAMDKRTAWRASPQVFATESHDGGGGDMKERGVRYIILAMRGPLKHI